jgi:isopentenyl-diphosphate delta-isomerase type 1
LPVLLQDPALAVVVVIKVMNKKEEILELVDDNGNVIGTAPRSECHKNPSLLHRVVHVFVFSTDGSLLLQKRSEAKDIQPGKWDTSVGGHVDPGETILQAAQRELSEELGISGTELSFLHTYKWTSERESELVYSFKTAYKGRINFDREEISQVAYFTASELKEKIGHNFFTPQFEYEWKNFDLSPNLTI